MSFYVDHLGVLTRLAERRQGGRSRLPTSSRGAFVLHLSTHHGDGTPGGVVLVEVRGIEDLHRELHSKDYRFMNPGLDEGPGELLVSTESIDLFGNLIRFFERNVDVWSRLLRLA